MPYVSKRQMRWAYATEQPFAEKWEKMTPHPDRLPERKRKRHVLRDVYGLK